MINNLMGKRFLFATLAIICGSVVTITLKYPDVSYLKLVSIITGIFVAGQTYSDIKEHQENGRGKP